MCVYIYIFVSLFLEKFYFVLMMSQNPILLSSDLRICWLYPLRKGKTFSATKKSKTLHCIWWRVWSSSLLLLPPAKLWPGVAISVNITSTDQINLLAICIQLDRVRNENLVRNGNAQMQMLSWNKHDSLT